MNEYPFYPSYTALSLWNTNKIEEAVACYFHLDELQTVTPAMDRGKVLHEQIAAEIERTHSIPAMIAGREIGLHSPLVEERMYFPVDEEKQIHFTGIIDCIDKSAIYDWKFSRQPAEVWAESMQIPCYGILASENNHNIQYGAIYRYSPDTGERDAAMVFLSEETLIEARNWITRNALGMYFFLQTHELFKQFNSRRN